MAEPYFPPPPNDISEDQWMELIAAARAVPPRLPHGHPMNKIRRYYMTRFQHLARINRLTEDEAWALVATAAWPHG